MGQSGSSEKTAQPRPKPEEKPLREIYEAQLDGREDETKLLLPEEMQAAEMIRVVGMPLPQDDAWRTYWDWDLSLKKAGITRTATTLGELSQMRMYHPPLRIFTPSPSFLNSDAAQVYLGELRDSTELEQLLEAGCASDDEKTAMRSIVQNALCKLHQEEFHDLCKLYCEECQKMAARHRARREAEMDQLDPTGEMRRAAATRTAKKLTVAQLRIKLAELGQATNGTKPVLVERYVARVTRRTRGL